MAYDGFMVNGYMIKSDFFLILFKTLKY